MLIIDAAGLYPRYSRSGALYSLDVIDGATIKPLIRQDGRAPAPPTPPINKCCMACRRWISPTASCSICRATCARIVSTATSQMMRTQAAQEGLAPLKGWVKQVLDRVLAVCRLADDPDAFGGYMPTACEDCGAEISSDEPLELIGEFDEIEDTPGKALHCAPSPLRMPMVALRQPSESSGAAGRNDDAVRAAH